MGHGQRSALLSRSDIVRASVPCFAEGVLPLGHHEGVCLVRGFALAGRLIQTDQRNQTLLDTIGVLGGKLVIPHAVHNAQMGHQLHIGCGPVRDLSLVCVGQRRGILMDFAGIEPIGPGQHDRRLLPGDGSRFIQVAIFPAL